ncbi:cytochrome c family protein [Siculibacillus lacustris]|uniref:Cytochrome c family protein n=1 Tax=Siculibacillus lacustris TaxID=1549641 RepID=A0A4V2KTA5_9HYPH|nr:cytochrome c family protein [Siculibacillus lacustris]TBW36446.1 cytochrome c family protein [Siculibacillus lacustris]
MDFYEVNKFAGALFGAGIWAMAVGMAASFVFAPEMPAKPGFAVAVEGAGGAETAKAAAPATPIEERLKTADAARGQKDFAKCASCHTPEKGAGAKVGPNLWGVVAGPKAHMEGFKYSSGMAERGKAGEKWTFADLDKFLTDPKAFVPGTAMGFAGFKDGADRADVILYLRSLADAPVALPN